MECGAPLAALHTMAEMKSNGGTAANPHGIDHILSRPSSVSMIQGPAVRNLPPAALTAAAAAANYYKQAAAAASHPLSELTSRSTLYWPGLQGLVGNPMAWRDRLAN
ncbi:unnamed protein product, partial [Nesidiocoris tenuis]